MNQSLSMKTVLHILLFSVIFVGIISFSMIVEANADYDTGYKQITVQSGDSLWSIYVQEEIEMNQTDFIDWVMKRNNLQHSTIYAGQVITVPVKVKDEK